MTEQIASDTPKINLDGVPDYATTDDETRALMDELMATIDPYNINTVIQFGREPLERLGDVADQVMRRSDADNAVFGSLDTLQGQLESIDIGELAAKAANLGAKGASWVIKNPGTALVSAASSTVLGPLALVGVPFAKHSLDKAKAKRQGGDVADELRKSVAKSQEVIGSLETARVQIPRAIESLDELGRARLVAYKDVSLYIGAGVERLRRLNDEELPAMREAANGNYEAEINLQTLSMSSDMLGQRVNDMLASRLVSQATMATLVRLRGVFSVAAGKVESHMTLSVPQWRAQMAESGVVLAAHKVTQAINQADEFGTRLLTQGAKVADRTKRMMDDSARSGTYNTERVIGVLTSMASSLQDDVRQIGTRRSDLEEDRKRLSSASESFRLRVSQLAEAANGQLALPVSRSAAAGGALEDHSGGAAATGAAGALSRRGGPGQHG